MTFQSVEEAQAWLNENAEQIVQGAAYLAWVQALPELATKKAQS